MPNNISITTRRFQMQQYMAKRMLLNLFPFVQVKLTGSIYSYPFSRSCYIAFLAALNFDNATRHSNALSTFGRIQGIVAWHCNCCSCGFI